MSVILHGIENAAFSVFQVATEQQIYRNLQDKSADATLCHSLAGAASCARLQNKTCEKTRNAKSCGNDACAFFTVGKCVNCVCFTSRDDKHRLLMLYNLSLFLFCDAILVLHAAQGRVELPHVENNLFLLLRYRYAVT